MPSKSLTRLLMLSTVVCCALLVGRMVSAQEKGKAMNAGSPYTSNLQTAAPHSPQDFAPDGNLEKSAWKNAKWVKFDHDPFTLKHFPGAETAVASFWTSEYVYFAFRCKYATLNTYEGEDPAKERWELWNRDVVEVFANPEPGHVNHYYEFEVAPHNQWIDLEIDLDKTPFNDAKWDSGFEHATRVDASYHVWTCEMRIPLRSMNVQHLEPGAEWRVNFFRADGPGNDTKRRFMAWSPIQSAKHSFHAPTSFGVIRFEK
jgi:alpha-galactosidase